MPSSLEKVPSPSHSWWPPVALVALIVVVYANGLEGVFLFDDTYRIVDNPGIRSLWPITPLLNNDRPLVELSLAVNYAIGKLDPRGYHLFNIVVHALAALTLGGVVGRSLGSARNDTRDAHPLLPWVVAAMWAVHPLQTQSATYIIQRGESMMGWFYLLTIFCAIRRRDSRCPRAWFIAATIACACGMGSKAVMITAPFAVLLHDFIFWKEGSTRRKATQFAALAATWSVLWFNGLFTAVLDQSQPNTGVGLSVTNVTATSYLLTQAEVLVHYVRLTLWPVGLCLDYEWPFVAGAGEVALELCVVIPALMMTMVGILKRRWWGFPAGFFFLVLAPTSSIIPVKDAIFEHRMYLPVAGLIVLGLGVGVRLAACLPVPWRWQLVPLSSGLSISPAAKRAQCFAAMVVIAALALATFQRNRVYASELSMWMDVAAKRPGNARARVAIGNAYLAVDHIDDALAAFNEAIRIRPEFADAHAALGMGLARQGDLAAAVTEYETAIRLEPRHAKAHFNLGNALQRQGKFEAAVAAYRNAVESNGRFTDARCNLGNALGKLNRDAEAEQSYLDAIRIDPNHPRSLNNLGDLFLRTRRAAEAIPVLLHAVTADPNYANAHANLAAAYLQTGQRELAIRLARRALELSPDHPTATELLRDATGSDSTP